MENAIWILFVAGVVFIAQALLFVKMGLKRVRVQRWFTKKRLYENERLQMVEVIENRRIVPVPWLKIETRMPAALRFGRQENLEVDGSIHHSSMFFLAPWQRVRRTHEVQATHRGHYSLTTATLTAGDLFGVKAVTNVQEMKESLTVYPRLLSRNEIRLPASRWQGERMVKRFINPDPFLYSGIRDYRPGDAPRDVHWRAYARTGELKIKQHDYTANSKVMILLNIAPTEDLWGEIGSQHLPMLEQAIRVAASLAHFALEDGLDAGFGCNADMQQFEGDPVFLQPSSGAQQQSRILEAMARLRVRRVLNFHEYLKSLPPVTDMDIVLLSCYTSPLIEQQLERMRANGNTISWHPFPTGEKEAAV